MQDHALGAARHGRVAGPGRHQVGTQCPDPRSGRGSGQEDDRDWKKATSTAIQGLRQMLRSWASSIAEPLLAL